MLDYAALAALAEIIRRGSFEAAAAALGVTPSAVSQRIKGLEERMGEVLIHRGPPARGTATGLRLMQHLDQVRLLEQALGTDPGTVPATLRIAVNADSLATWFPPVMTALPAIYDLVVDDQDHARDWLRKGEVSAAISSDPEPVPGCDVVALGRMRYHALATPAFIARHFPQGPTEAALRQAPAVIFNMKDAAQTRWAEALDKPTLLVGDFNIAPLDCDVYDHKALLKVVSHTPLEVETLGRLGDAHGWVDLGRKHIPAPERNWSWWSYRTFWQGKDRGRRLDHMWASPQVAAQSTDHRVIEETRHWEQCSDHVPLITDIAL